MHRRDLLTLLAAAALARPLAASAAPQVIGFLSSGSAEGFATLLQAFREGLQQAGYREGENLTIRYAWAAGNYDRLPAMAADLVGQNVSVIVAAGGAVAALAAKGATTAIPIVIAIGDDPIKFGLVDSLSRPSGNITGVTLFMGELAPKRVELLAELMPNAALVMLVNPQNPNADGEAEAAQGAAHRSGRELAIVKAAADTEIEAALADIARQPGRALVVGTDPFFYARRDRISALAMQHSLPAIYFHRGFASAGGLLSYGATITAEYRIAGTYTARILGGAKPADLPILQPSTIELVVNMKTAKALGITVPNPILLRADEILE